MIGLILNNRYKILSLLGEGGMGEVYLAIDQPTSQQVALKVLARQLSTNPESLERFKREAETLRQLDHPNIVKFVDAFELEGQYVIVMEYVAGGSLFDLLKQGPLPIERSRQIALDLCDALIRAHRINIIHRDIKPENVLLSSDGTPKLADFGVARLSEGGRMTRTGTQVGTPYYMSPEAWEGKILDEQADIWSLGVVLYEMLAGQVPFYGDTGPAVMTKVFSTRPPDIKKLRADVPSKLTKVVRQMLMRDKKYRYLTMREVAVELERGRELKVRTEKQSESVDIRETTTFPKNNTSKNKRLIRGMSAGIFVLGSIVILSMGINPLLNLFRQPPPTAFIASTATANSAVAASVTHTVKPEATSTSTPDPALIVGSSATRQIDGMTMMYIPPGEFLMGSIGGDGDEDERPQHTVFLNPFWIDQTEVTNSMYSRCMLVEQCGAPVGSEFIGIQQFANYPVSSVTWEDAKAYCEWSGARLPTEAEWEKAARGSLEGNLYPWGNESPTCSRGRVNGAQTQSCGGDPAPIRSFLPNGYGLYDMAGNAWEWVFDWYDPTYYAQADEFNPLGPSNGVIHVLRGGSWNYPEEFVEVASRFQGSGTNFPRTPFLSVGFRCVRDEIP